MFTAAKKITNLVWLVDNNKKQLDSYTSEILDTGDLRAKFEAFGFDAVRVDGHDVEAIYDAVTKVPGDKPIAVILDTVKAKGIKEAEETFSNHSMTPGEEKFNKWLDQLKAELAEMV